MFWTSMVFSRACALSVSLALARVVLDVCLSQLNCALMPDIALSAGAEKVGPSPEKMCHQFWMFALLHFV